MKPHLLQTATQQLKRGAIASFFVMTSGVGISFLSSALLARFLGVTGYGIYAFCLSWINIAVIVSRLGFDTVILKYAPRYLAQPDFARVKSLLRYANSITLIASLTVCAIGYGAVAVAYRHDAESGTYQTFLIALLTIPVLTLSLLRSAALRAAKRVIQATLPEFVLRPAMMMLFAGAAFLLSGNQLVASQAMVMNMGATVVTFVLGTVLLRMALPKEVWVAGSGAREPEWLVEAMPLLFISAMYVFYRQIDVVMVGLLLGESSTGVYSACTRLAELVVFPLTVVNTIVAPLLSEHYSRGNHRELQIIVTKAATWIFIASVVCGFALILLATLLLGVFGDDFVVGTTPLRILVIGQVIGATCGPVGYTLIMSNRQLSAAKILGASVVLNVVLDYLLIPRFGLPGAALASSVSVAGANIVMTILAMTKVGINTTVFVRRKKDRAVG